MHRVRNPAIQHKYLENDNQDPLRLERLSNENLSPFRLMQSSGLSRELIMGILQPSTAPTTRANQRRLSKPLMLSSLPDEFGERKKIGGEELSQ